MTDAQLRAERRQSMTGQRERLVTTRPIGARGQQEATCSPCGAGNRASARYCSQCGATLAGDTRSHLLGQMVPMTRSNGSA